MQWRQRWEQLFSRQWQQQVKANAHIVQTSSAAHNEGVLFGEPQSRREAAQTARPKDGPYKACFAGYFQLFIRLQR